MAAALIISAGKTDHKDGFSPERQIGRISAIERMAQLFQLAGVQRIVAVGDARELPQKLVSASALDFLTLPDGGEMLDGIRLGLQYLEGKCAEVFVAHVDVPMFSQRTLQLLLDASGDVCIPSCRGRCGHPVLLRARCFGDVVSYHGPGGLRGAIIASGRKPQIVETADAGILTEAQNGFPYETLLENHDASRLKASFKLRISKEKGFYGPGAHQLLQLTEELGSLSSACQHMGMSYTKGRRIISTMEEQLGTAVLETQQGGKTGGSSRLTEAAQKMMASYSALQREADAALQEIFEKYFSEMLE